MLQRRRMVEPSCNWYSCTARELERTWRDGRGRARVIGSDRDAPIYWGDGHPLFKIVMQAWPEKLRTDSQAGSLFHHSFMEDTISSRVDLLSSSVRTATIRTRLDTVMNADDAGGVPKTQFMAIVCFPSMYKDFGGPESTLMVWSSWSPQETAGNADDGVIPTTRGGPRLLFAVPCEREGVER
ncbi:hypothetical protein BDN67DRAFT_984184 [Paxillus ammoniavirescens]|nr:hypothetical protein BDN67DRAFT_984184 [Paxillus ammoniavirescens]